MTTLQDEWRKYRNACYPNEIPAIQNRECHQAFFSGAFVVLQLALQVAENADENLAVKQMGKLFKEAEEVIAARVNTLKNRN